MEKPVKPPIFRLSEPISPTCEPRLTLSHTKGKILKVWDKQSRLLGQNIFSLTKPWLGPEAKSRNLSEREILVIWDKNGQICCISFRFYLRPSRSVLRVSAALAMHIMFFTQGRAPSWCTRADIWLPGTWWQCPNLAYSISFFKFHGEKTSVKTVSIYHKSCVEHLLQNSLLPDLV